MLRSALRSGWRGLRPRGARPTEVIGRRNSSSASGGEHGAARRLMQAYEHALEKRPILTKSVTSGTLYGIGDCVAQSMERRGGDGSTARQFDGARWLRAVAYGGLFYPLPAHIHYNFLEKLVVVRWATPTSRVPFTKMFIEQFVYWSYLSNAYYHGVLGALQGMGAGQIYDRIASTLWCAPHPCLPAVRTSPAAPDDAALSLSLAGTRSRPSGPFGYPPSSSTSVTSPSATSSTLCSSSLSHGPPSSRWPSRPKQSRRRRRPPTPTPPNRPTRRVEARRRDSCHPPRPPSSLPPSSLPSSSAGCRHAACNRPAVPFW